MPSPKHTDRNVLHHPQNSTDPHEAGFMAPRLACNIISSVPQGWTGEVPSLAHDYSRSDAVHIGHIGLFGGNSLAEDWDQGFRRDQAYHLANSDQMKSCGSWLYWPWFLHSAIVCPLNSATCSMAMPCPRGVGLMTPQYSPGEDPVSVVIPIDNSFGEANPLVLIRLEEIDEVLRTKPAGDLLHIGAGEAIECRNRPKGVGHNHRFAQLVEGLSRLMHRDLNRILRLYLMEHDISLLDGQAKQLAAEPGLTELAGVAGGEEDAHGAVLPPP